LSDCDCHGEVCNPGDHRCVQCLSDSQCDDHNACNGAETCVANTCHAGTPLTCDDHNVCTTDTCDATAGCKHDNNTAPCDDGNFSNGADTCSGGQCGHAAAPCTSTGDVCDPSHGACAPFLPDGACRDGRAAVCNPGDHQCVQCLSDANCDD